MRLNTLRNPKQLLNKRVLVRIDANVPIRRGQVVDGPQGKIARAAVDLEWLRQHGAKLVILTHLGRPNGKRTPAYSVAPIAKRLSGLLGVPVKLCRDVVGAKAEKMVSVMQSGEAVLLENVRFHAGEEQNSRAFARQLATLGDLYINDAFAVSHRAHASVDAITEELPSYAGPLLVREVNLLHSLHAAVRHPFLLIMGGLKISTKLPVLEQFLPHVEAVFIGGALAQTFLVAQGKEIGRSVYDKEGVSIARSLLERWGQKIRLPQDVYVARRMSSQAKLHLVSVEEIDAKDYVVDVGRRTMRTYVRAIQRAKTIVWNGPFGYCEIPKFCSSTYLLARAIAARTGKAKTIVGGGDTIPILEAAHLAEHFTLMSTGGGAMLEFLAGGELPGVEALK